jgi:hypothetical protein
VEWPPAEREDEIRRLQSFLDSAAKTRAEPVAAKPPSSPPELSPDDGERFTRARAALARGQKRTAYDLAKPLFDKYPDAYDVQDLRCQLAAIRWLPRDELLSECAPFQRLSAARSGRDGGVDGG